jgi:hypothetical protein
MTRSQLRKQEQATSNTKEDIGFKKMKNFEQDDNEHLIPYVMPQQASDHKWKDVTFDFANQV